MLTKILQALLSSAVLANSRPIRGFHWDNIKYVYTFGDSYSFVAGELGRPPASWIGDNTRLAFTPEQLFSNKILPNMTSSGGKNWLEYITGCFEGLPADCPVQLWDFAYGGSTIDDTRFPPIRNTTVQMNVQVRQWLDYAAPYLPRPEGRTLTTWWTGINECSHICNNDTITDVDAFLDSDIETYFDIVAHAARHGLRTHLFLTVPPVDRSPFAATVRGGPEAFRKMIELFNKKFVPRVAKYARDNPSQTVLFFDAAEVLNRILEHPKEFGFTNIETFCPECENQEEIFWHNDEHPTEHVHRILAHEVEQYLRHPDRHFW